MRILIPALLLVCLCTSSRVAEAASEPFIPPGFEDLLEPQTTQVDVYYGDQYLLSTLATFSPGEFTFMMPDEVVQRIPDLLDP
ncbi:MAG: hypothetical protein KDI36_15150, partial [Pseudomonadales bacterium]|nr:hypothetical protein [Pseudomonadales bacterium]